MSLSVNQLIANLDSISSLEDLNEFERLDYYIKQLLASRNTESAIVPMLRVFERFPEADDDWGIFWTILHELEKITGYEAKLVESVKRQPSFFGLMMINRLLNTGFTEVQGTNLLTLLLKIAEDKAQTETIRREAQKFVDWQKNEKL